MRSLPRELEHRVRYDVPLAPMTAWGIGGTASVLFSPASCGELALCVSYLRSQGTGYHVLGGGSNVLIDDGEIKVPIIRTVDLRWCDIEQDGDAVTLRCGSGTRIAEIVGMAAKNGWAGCEVLAGIPGTVGGAAAGNAGTSSGSIGDVIASADVVAHDAEIVTLDRKDLDLGYRRSALSNARLGVISSLVLRLSVSDPGEVRRFCDEILSVRSKQPTGARTAGSVFKNPPGDYAGRLLDAAGCKGLTVGACRVSTAHANFIENLGGASAADVRALIKICRERVFDKFGIELDTEVVSLGADHAA